MKCLLGALVLLATGCGDDGGVVETPPTDADAYAVYGVKPGSAGVAAEVVRGTPEP